MDAMTHVALAILPNGLIRYYEPDTYAAILVWTTEGPERHTHALRYVSESDTAIHPEDWPTRAK